MIVYLTTWVQTHTKLLALVGSLSSGAAAGGLVIGNYVFGVDERLDLVEQSDMVKQSQLDRIELDVSEIRCMVIEHHQGGDPLDCLNY